MPARRSFETERPPYAAAVLKGYKTDVPGKRLVTARDFFGSDQALLRASMDDVNALKSHLEVKGKPPVSIARTISILRQYYDFLITQGIRADNPVNLSEDLSLHAEEFLKGYTLTQREHMVTARNFFDSPEEMDRASEDLIQKYINQLKAEKKTPGSISTMLSPLRQYYAFLIRKGLRTDNPLGPARASPRHSFNEAGTHKTREGHAGPSLPSTSVFLKPPQDAPLPARHPQDSSGSHPWRARARRTVYRNPDSPFPP